MASLTAPSISWSGSGALDASFSQPTLAAGSGSFVVSGLLVAQHDAGYFHIAKYVGEPNVPADIKRLRRYVHELMRRMGTPVLIKKMLSPHDAHQGLAMESANFDDVYGQTRNHDPLSHGTGYCSIETSDTEFINSQGHIVLNDTGTSAPKYRGYGPGYLTYVIEPDATEDFFKHSPEGAFIKVQTATAQAPWWPDVNDNDLIIHVELDNEGFITDTRERYQAKMTNPISVRGAKERRGKSEYGGDFGSRYVVNQTFQMVLLPEGHVAYSVETDR
jgi:hypothetical protein